MQLCDGAFETSTSVMVGPSSLDHISLSTLCSLEKIDSHEMLLESTDMMDDMLPYDEHSNEMLVMDMG